MLEDLHIKDFALIDDAHIEFSHGFTVLSGETGAGKSLLIGALSFLLGGKSGTEQIRAGCHEATVCGTFLLDGRDTVLRADSVAQDDDECRSAAEWLFRHGIAAEDNRILLRRYVRDNGKTGAWIGDTAVTRADLAAFSAFLVDIHGQHEHQSLMKVVEHRRFLDSFAGLHERVSAFTALYADLVAKRKRLDELDADDAGRAQKIEILTFAIKEIADAKLKAGEDKALDDEETKLSSFEKLYADITSLNAALDAGGEGAVALLKRIRGTAYHACSLDKSLEALQQRLETVFYELDDIAGEYKHYEHGLVFDPDRLAQVQERLTLIYNLKKKYAASVSAPVEDVIAYAENAQRQLDSIAGGAAGKEQLRSEIAALEKRVYAEAKAISAERKTAAAAMAQGVEQVLSQLGMKGTRFSVSIVEKNGTELEQKCGPYGIDNIEFLISANSGEPLRGLAKIASGGELSRVMLALKTILAGSDPVQTLVFDEIDTGIGGEVAVSVGTHLKKLAKNRQVLCITHLASIAVCADNQVKIEKGMNAGATQTRVFPIAADARVQEIARMLSGDSDSAESLEHARSMLQRFGA
ncbi:MAG: DNA repair protein RecN [Treponemataceae bacterium]|nr:DNA repair protein RecN [Treponemataceae bacterium]